MEARRERRRAVPIIQVKNELLPYTRPNMLPLACRPCFAGIPTTVKVSMCVARSSRWLTRRSATLWGTYSKRLRTTHVRPRAWCCANFRHDRPCRAASALYYDAWPSAARVRVGAQNCADVRWSRPCPTPVLTPSASSGLGQKRQTRADARARRRQTRIHHNCRCCASTFNCVAPVLGRRSRLEGSSVVRAPGSRGRQGSLNMHSELSPRAQHGTRLRDTLRPAAFWTLCVGLLVLAVTDVHVRAAAAPILCSLDLFH